jgi:hypothetical protein
MSSTMTDSKPWAQQLEELAKALEGQELADFEAACERFSGWMSDLGPTNVKRGVRLAELLTRPVGPRTALEQDFLIARLDANISCDIAISITGNPKDPFRAVEMCSLPFGMLDRYTRPPTRS